MYRKRHKRSEKNKISILILVFIFCLSIGYAFLNTMLSISGTIDVKGNTWNVYYDNINVKTGSVTATTIPSTSDTNSSLNAVFSLLYPGEYFEFTVDVVNDGTIDAYLDSFLITPVLTDTQKGYVNYTVEYQNGEPLVKGQLVPKGEFVRLKFRMEHRTDYTDSQVWFDNISSSIKLNYIPNRGQGVKVNNNGVKIKPEIISGNLGTIGSEICIGSECFYLMKSTSDSVTMLAKYNLYVGFEWNEEIGDYIEIDVTTVKQSDVALGGYDGIGTLQFSNEEYWINYDGNYGPYKDEYYNPNLEHPYYYDSNSYLYTYVEQYKQHLSTQGVTLLEARLIMYEELRDLGCDYDTCELAPSWVYSTTYWTGSSGFEVEYITGVVNELEELHFYMTSEVNNLYGLRPVIVIPRNGMFENDNGEITKTIINFTIDGTPYQAEEGMTWDEWETSEYNIDNLDTSGICVKSGPFCIVYDDRTIEQGVNYTFTSN